MSRRRIIYTIGRASLATGVVGLCVWLCNRKKVVLFKLLASPAGLPVDDQRTKKWDPDWDRRDPRTLCNDGTDGVDAHDDSLQKYTAVASRHIILVRHGQAVHEHKKTEVKDYDPLAPLSELGRVQAALAGGRLKELGFSYSRIVSSTMLRAKDTARIIHEHLPEIGHIEYSDLLREGPNVPPEPSYGYWKPQHKFLVHGACVEAGFRAHFHRANPNQKEDSYEVICAHANVIRYCVCRALQLPPEGWLKFALHHASITWITILPTGHVKLRMLGDSGYIPANQLSLRNKY